MADVRTGLRGLIKARALANGTAKFQGPDANTTLELRVERGRLSAINVLAKDGRLHPAIPNPRTAQKKCYHVTFHGGEPRYQRLACNHPEVNFAVYD